VAGGSTLVELRNEGEFGHFRDVGEWKPKLQLQLAANHCHFVRFCKERHLTSSQGVFTVSTLSMSKKRDHPVLKAKAYNGLLIIDRLADRCQKQTAFKR
jgi:hypothetical protein